MEDVVILRHAEKDFTVRGSVLRYHSSVLDGIIADGAPTEEGIVLTMDGVSFAEVECFLALAHHLSHRSNERNDELNVPYKQHSMDDIVGMAKHAMPMIHKYDAAGLLNLCRAAVNAKPDTMAIYAILKHDDSMDWMTSDTLDFLMKEILSWFNREKVSAMGQDGLTALRAARETLEDMPPSVVNAFLLYVMGRPDLEIRDLRQRSKAN